MGQLSQNTMRTKENPYIAYGVGRSHDIVHVDCWDAYADSKATFDAQGRPSVQAYQALLYYPAALMDSLHGKSCAQCGRRLSLHPLIPLGKPPR